MEEIPNNELHSSGQSVCWNQQSVRALPLPCTPLTLSGNVALVVAEWELRVVLSCHTSWGMALWMCIYWSWANGREKTENWWLFSRKHSKILFELLSWYHLLFPTCVLQTLETMSWCLSDPPQLFGTTGSCGRKGGDKATLHQESPRRPGNVQFTLIFHSCLWNW